MLFSRLVWRQACRAFGVYEAISGLDGAHPHERARKTGPHRNGNPVSFRLPDEVRSPARLSFAHHQEAAYKINHLRAVVVFEGRYQHQIPKRPRREYMERMG